MNRFCGSGKFSILLKNRFPHLQVTAVDLSLENVHTARVNAQNTDTELSTLPASTLDLPFQNASFDLVLCVYMLQHTSDPQKGFQESVRVLKPGGTAFYAIGRENGLGKIHVRTRRLFHWVPAKFRNLSVAPLFPFYYALTHLLKRRKASYREMGKDMVDWLYNPLQNFIDEDEIENWFRQNRLSFEHLGYTGLLKSMLICRGQKQAEVT